MTTRTVTACILSALWLAGACAVRPAAAEAPRSKADVRAGKAKPRVQPSRRGRARKAHIDPNTTRVARLQRALDAGTFVGRPDAVAAAAALVQAHRPEADREEVIDCLVASGASMLDSSADWTRPESARPVYNLLKRYDGDRVVDALVKRVREGGDDRLRTLFLAVKLGIAGSEYRLNALLDENGDKSMAEDYLNSGSGALRSGGERWASAHGYRVSTGPGSHRTRWGDF